MDSPIVYSKTHVPEFSPLTTEEQQHIIAIALKDSRVFVELRDRGPKAGKFQYELNIGFSNSGLHTLGYGPEYLMKSKLEQGKRLVDQVRSRVEQSEFNDAFKGALLWFSTLSKPDQKRLSQLLSDIYA